jgi:uncharacterized protein (TIGR02145 family)
VVKPYRVQWEAENAIKRAEAEAARKVTEAQRRAEAEVKAKEAEIVKLRQQVAKQTSAMASSSYENNQPKKMLTAEKVALSITCIGILLLGYSIFIINKSLAPPVVHTNEVAQEPQSEQKAAVETDETTVKNTFTDSRNSKTYKTVKIGSQIWMAENLNYNASDSKCYDNTPANCNKYGRLYNWNTAIKACPSGWHLPGKAEWHIMIEAVGGYSIVGTKLKAKSGGNTGSSYKLGTDNFGFSALPGGYGDSGGSFNFSGYNGYWWSSSEHLSYAYSRDVGYNYAYVNRDSYDKSNLFSVRCVQDLSA